MNIFLLLFWGLILTIHDYLLTFVKMQYNMEVLAEDQKTFIEIHADEILKERGISKAQFAKAMGVAPQNFNKLVATKNIVTLTNIAKYLNLPLNSLIFGKAEQERSIRGCVFVDDQEHMVRSKKDLEDLINAL